MKTIRYLLPVILLFTLITGAVVSAQVIAQADLSVTKNVSPNPVLLGENATYNFIVSNAGPQTAVNATLNDVLPAGLSFQSGSISQGSCTISGTNTVSCTFGDIAPGGHATLSVVMKTTAAGEVSNTSTVSSETADPNPANNSATALLTVNESQQPESSVGGIAVILTSGPGSSSTPYIIIIGITATLVTLALGGWFIGRRRLGRYS